MLRFKVFFLPFKANGCFYVLAHELYISINGKSRSFKRLF